MAIYYRLPYPFVSKKQGPGLQETYFMISLVLMMRLISSIIRELTHTERQPKVSPILMGRLGQLTHSLFGSENRFDSWNCSHIEQTRFFHPQELGSRTLFKGISFRHIHESWVPTKEFMAVSS